MDKWKKLFEQFSQKMDLINTIMGIVLIVSVFFIYKNPSNQYAILTACISGGFINILNGIKQMKQPKYKVSGMTFFMLGVIIIFIGFIILNMLQ